MKLIYVAHPYGGLSSNKKKVERIIKKLARVSPENVYISPIHAFGYMYKSLDYDDGLTMCVELLKRCDSALFYGDWEKSDGCRYEMTHCRMSNKPYLIIDKGDIL